MEKKEENKMTRKVLSTMFLAVVICASAAGAFAQGRMQGARGGMQAGSAAGLVTLTGQVVSVNMAAGQGLPSFRFLAGGKEVTVMTGPYRTLAAQGFEIAVGSQLTVTAYPSLRQENTYVAVQIKNDATGAVIDLGGRGRGNFGRRGGARMGAGPLPGACLQNFDPSKVQELQGTVGAVNMAAGRRQPNFTLMTALGQTTILVGPYRLIAQEGFRIDPGDSMVVKAYPCLQVEGAYVAISLQNLSKGQSITLRQR